MPASRWHFIFSFVPFVPARRDLGGLFSCHAGLDPASILFLALGFTPGVSSSVISEICEISVKRYIFPFPNYLCLSVKSAVGPDLSGWLILFPYLSSLRGEFFPFLPHVSSRRAGTRLTPIQSDTPANGSSPEAHHLALDWPISDCPPPCSHAPAQSIP